MAKHKTQRKTASKPSGKMPRKLAIEQPKESAPAAKSKAKATAADPIAAPLEVAAAAPVAPAKRELLNRELAILQFNRRVLAQAKRDDVPLLERLRYLCIVSSNLDEFFEIRISDYLPLNGKAPEMPDAARWFGPVIAEAQALVQEQYEVLARTLMPMLKKEGIEILSHAERDAAQMAWVAEFFQREVRPLLIPIALDPAHPFPQVANKSLNFIVRLSGKDAFGRENSIAIVKVPRVVPRVIRLPEKVSNGKQVFVLLSSVIRAHLHELFPDREVVGFSQFRVTRDSDLSVDEQDVTNLRQALRLNLTARHFGNAVRLEVGHACPPDLYDFLLKQFSLPPEALFLINGPVNLVRFTTMIDQVTVSPKSKLLFAAYAAQWPKSVPAAASIFDTLQKGDVLLHHPFESFDPVVSFLRQAVADPQVLAIKMTIYRAGSDSVLMDLLIEAARRGKEVTAVVELKARFDEEANINWAERLESVGAQVVYGVVGLKTHGKALLITRREGKKLARYAHLSTGNYNLKTARLYTDLGYLTADPELTADVEQVFQHLASQSKVGTLKHLLMAPFTLHKAMIAHLHEVRDAALAGKPARVVARMNALLDEPLIEALIEAGAAGAKVDLIVRGACVLPPGLKGWTDNIRVRSIVGRFLEHTRAFYFRAGTKEALYLASADWMGRNMFRRIELAWPIRDKKLRQRVIDEALTPYLLDGVDAFKQLPDGTYQSARSAKPSAQRSLMQIYGGQ